MLDTDTTEAVSNTEAKSAAVNEEEPLILHSLSTVHEIIECMMQDRTGTNANNIEILQTLAANVNAMRCTLDPTLSAKDFRDAYVQKERTEEEGVGPGASASASVSASTPTATSMSMHMSASLLPRIRSITVELWGDIEHAEQREVALQQRRLQRTQEKERGRLEAAKKMQQLAATVTGESCSQHVCALVS